MTVRNQENRKTPAARAALLVNAVGNPEAGIDKASFSGGWTWIRTPENWVPAQGLPNGSQSVDVVVVFSKPYEEEKIRALCENVRGEGRLASVPLLVAVSQYEMPLANRVKELPNADFIFRPIKESDLVDRLERIRVEA